MEAIKDKNMDLYSREIFEQTLEEKMERPRTRSNTKINTFALKRTCVVSASVISFLLILYMVLGYTEMVSINSDRKVLEGEIKSLELTIDSLELKLDPYTSRKRVEQIATNRLGMTYPTEKNIVRINNSKNEKQLIAEEVEEQGTNSLLSYLTEIIR